MWPSARMRSSIFGYMSSIDSASPCAAAIRLSRVVPIAPVYAGGGGCGSTPSCASTLPKFAAWTCSELANAVNRYATPL